MISNDHSIFLIAPSCKRSMEAAVVTGPARAHLCKQDQNLCLLGLQNYLLPVVVLDAPQWPC